MSRTLASLFPSYWYFGSAQNVSFVILISHSLVKYHDKQWLIKHLPSVCDYGASTHQGTWVTVPDAKEWLTFPRCLWSPLLLYGNRDLTEMTVGRLIKSRQPNPLFERTAWLGERLSFKYISRQFPGLGWGRKIREGGVRRMPYQVTLWRGRWKVQCSLFPPAQSPGGNLMGSNNDEPRCGAGATWLSVSWGSSAFLPSGSSLCPWRASPGCTCRARGSAQHHPGSAFPTPRWRHAGAREAPQTWSSHSTQDWSCVLHVWSASSSASRTDASASPWQKHLYRKWRETPN